MMDCTSCHSDTHNVQANIYSAGKHPLEATTDRILSPMYLTHVECTGCHVEKSDLKPGAVASIGRVARAVPEACDSCHEPGTGRRYIPFWQKKIKGLYKAVSLKLSAAGEPVPERLKRAAAILEAVEVDGSWGVHNLKYTETMLLEAERILDRREQ
jgi:hypothetical protein